MFPRIRGHLLRAPHNEQDPRGCAFTKNAVCKDYVLFAGNPKLWVRCKDLSYEFDVSNHTAIIHPPLGTGFKV